MDRNITSVYIPPKSSEIKHRRTTLERIEKFISKDYFTDVNLYGKLYRQSLPIEDITTHPLKSPWWEVKFGDIICRPFEPAKIGDSFGPAWSTHWFKLQFRVPDEWRNEYVVLRWVSQSEALIYSDKGECLQGLTTGTDHQLRTDYCISERWETSSKTLTYYIEMAGSRMFGVGKGGMINPPDPDIKFTLTKAEIAVMDTTIYHLMIDLHCLHSIAKNLAEDHRGYLALYTGNDMINKITEGDLRSAKELAKSFFSKKGGDLQNTLALIGNCHIDCAWLWPYSETKRKCARSFSSAIQLLDKYDDMIFVISQAQQLQWTKECYPLLFEKIKEKVSQNRIIPVGSTWVEMDGLLPCGESFMRQFLYGQKFFKEEFGFHCKEFWLPDTFGYSGQIPQICRHFDIGRFLTQKLSWSLVNKFPHHTFIWEGIDRSQILAHFPPGDSYEMDVQVEEMVRSEKNLQDKGRTNVSGFLYGHGDGGGGPTQDMLERAKRLSNIDGLPRLKHMTPDELFTILEGQSGNLCKWTGELYLELHNGTYTSQAEIKYQNIKCEWDLRHVETLVCYAALKGLMEQSELKRLQLKCEEAWKKVLVNQFHDVLPGSSIEIACKEAHELYKQAERIYIELFEVIPFLAFDSLFNPFQWNLYEVSDGQLYQTCPLSSKRDIIETSARVSWEKNNLGYLIRNDLIKVQFSKYGQILWLGRLDENMEDNQESGIFSERKRGNVIAIYDDIPLFWDAWDVMDYHLETRKVLNNDDSSKNGELKLNQSSDVLIELSWTCHISDSSSLKQFIILPLKQPYVTFRNEVSWKESHKFLKVEFDTNLLCREALYETQFGYVSRPTHRNTSWDTARFEVCSHRWMSLRQPGLGLAILNRDKYGASAIDGKMSLSLLRSPKAPDANCDMGHHGFEYAAMPHGDDLMDVIKAAQMFIYNFWRPCSVDPFLEIEDSSVVLEAMKLSETSTSAIVFRLYEAIGGLAKTRIILLHDREVKNVFECNGLEDPRKELSWDSKTRSVSLSFKPFEIKTIKLELAEV